MGNPERSSLLDDLHIPMFNHRGDFVLATALDRAIRPTPAKVVFGVGAAALAGMCSWRRQPAARRERAPQSERTRMRGADFENISPTTLAEALGHEQVMDIRIRPLWPSMPRVAGPAFTVRCPPGDNLMLHAAIYRAAPGSIVVVEAGDVDYAVAGGNVCAVAKRRGIAAFVVDGVIRDLAETRKMAFPVFARGVIPIPGAKTAVVPLNAPVRCGGVNVYAGDMVVADEEGIIVVPSVRQHEVLRAAKAKIAKEAGESLDAWEAAHRARIERILADNAVSD